MRFLRILIVALVVLAAFAALTPGVSADEDVQSCSEATLSYEVVLNWAFEYLHVSVTTGTPVVRIFNYEIEVGPTTVVDFDIEYYSDSGELVLASGSFVLSDDCTPDFAASTAGWTCNTTAVTESFEEVVDEGSGLIVIMSYEEWYDWAIDIGFLKIGTHYEEWELWVFYYEYLITVGIDITTLTTTCTPPPWQPGPVTLHNAGNGSLREAFPVRAYFVNASEHPDLDAGLRSDPHGTVNGSSYLGELAYEGMVDVVGGGDVYVVLAPHSMAAGYNILVVVCGVEAPGQCEFAAYWAVTDADNNGEMEGSLVSYATSYFNEAAWYTHSPDQPANWGN